MKVVEQKGLFDILEKKSQDRAQELTKNPYIPLHLTLQKALDPKDLEGNWVMYLRIAMNQNKKNLKDKANQKEYLSAIKAEITCKQGLKQPRHSLRDFLLTSPKKPSR